MRLCIDFVFIDPIDVLCCCLLDVLVHRDPWSGFSLLAIVAPCSFKAPIQFFDQSPNELMKQFLHLFPFSMIFLFSQACEPALLHYAALNSFINIIAQRDFHSTIAYKQWFSLSAAKFMPLCIDFVLIDLIYHLHYHCSKQGENHCSFCLSILTYLKML